MTEKLKSNTNHVRLTEDLIRDGQTYPKGTEGYLIGMLSPFDSENNHTPSLGIQIGECFIEVTKDIKNCTDFKYEIVNKSL